jgi:hypothetical protein
MPRTPGTRHFRVGIRNISLLSCGISRRYACWFLSTTEYNILMNMLPCGPTLEVQLSSIMDVLAKAAVSEISQLFLEGSATFRLQITQSLKENQSLRMRMKVMRSELFFLRLQTRSNASCAASRFALARDNICTPQTKPLGNGELFSGFDRWKTRRPPSVKARGHYCYICSNWKNLKCFIITIMIQNEQWILPIIPFLPPWMVLDVGLMCSSSSSSRFKHRAVGNSTHLQHPSILGWLLDSICAKKPDALLKSIMTRSWNTSQTW